MLITAMARSRLSPAQVSSLPAEQVVLVVLSSGQCTSGRRDSVLSMTTSAHRAEEPRGNVGHPIGGTSQQILDI